MRTFLCSWLRSPPYLLATRHQQFRIMSRCVQLPYLSSCLLSLAIILVLCLCSAAVPTHSSMRASHAILTSSRRARSKKKSKRSSFEISSPISGVPTTTIINSSNWPDPQNCHVVRDSEGNYHTVCTWINLRLYFNHIVIRKRNECFDSRNGYFRKSLSSWIIIFFLVTVRRKWYGHSFLRKCNKLG